MSVIAYIDLAKILDDAGFPAGPSQVNGLAVVTAESGRDPSAKFINTDKWSSTDRGLWMINNHWHAEVTDTCAYDAVCATKAAFMISSGGTNYGPWSTWGNGAYVSHLEAARVAVDGWSRIKQLNITIGALKAQIAALNASVSADIFNYSQLLNEKQALESSVLSAVTAIQQVEAALQLAAGGA